jgi:hypothetical protein
VKNLFPVLTIKALRVNGRRTRVRLIAEAAVLCLVAAFLTWTGINYASSVSNSLPWGGGWFVVVSWWYLFVCCLPEVALVLDTWIITIRYRGFPRIGQALQLMEPSKAGAIYCGLMSVVMLGLSVVVSYRFPIMFPFLIFFPLRFLVGLSHAVQPPTVLILAASAEKSLWLQERISKTLVPHRVVSLLKVIDPIMWEKRHTTADIVRTKTDQIWRLVVTGLLKIVPIALIDARTETDAVREEISQVQLLGLEYKTIFIVGAGGRSTSLVNDHTSNSDGTWVHDWMVDGFLWYVTHYRKVQPSATLSMRTLYMDYREAVVLAGGNGAEHVSHLETILDRFATKAAR